MNKLLVLSFFILLLGLNYNLFAQSTIWSDDFETDKGWSFTGEFERGTPNGSAGETINYGNDNPTSAYNGTNVIGTDLDGAYPDDLSDRAYTATSPVINCSGYYDITLTFRRWLNVEQNAYDNAYIEYYNGSSWTTIWSNPNSTIEDDAWFFLSYTLPASAENNSNVRIRFSLGSTDVAWNYSGWNIDDIIIKGIQTGDYRSVRDGNWSTLNTWQRYNGSSWVTPTTVQGYPGQNTIPGNVEIDNGDNVTLNVSPANNIGSLTIEFGSQDSYLTFSGTNSLTVIGKTSLYSNSNRDHKAVRVDAGILTTGSLSLSSDDANRMDAYVRISTGTVNVLGDIIMNNTNKRTYIRFDDAGILNIGGDISGGGISSDASGAVVVSGTVNYNSSSSQNVGNYTYYNLNLSGIGPFTTIGNITVNNDFSASGQINTAYDIILNGATQCGGSVDASSGTVYYTGNATHIIAGTYYTLQKNGGATSTLCDNITVANNLQLNGGIIRLEDYNLTISNGASITPTTAYSASNMIETTGAGYLIKESTTETGFEILYPTGSGGYYSPMDLTNGFTASVSGTGSVKVRAVAGSQGNGFLQKYWEVKTENLPSISAAYILFTYDNTEVNGTQSNYAPWVKPEGGSWKTPDNPTAAGNNPFGSTSSSDFNGIWTVGENTPADIVTWYAYSTSGNWNNANSWTLDGAANPTYNNPDSKVPSSSDKVVIPSGKKIIIQSTTNNLQVLEIDISGELDLTSSTGHDFGIIKGDGTIYMSGNSGVDNFPAGNITQFADPITGGMIEINGTGISLNTVRTFNNVKINLTSGSATLLADYTINGNLTVSNGNFKINDNSNTTTLNITVKGNVLVESLGTISVGTANATDGTAASGYGNYHKYFHVFTVEGDFTNQGSVRFTNQSAPVYDNRTTTGAVSLVFTGLSNNTLSCQGTTDLYYLVINKGTNQTYSLTVNAANKAYFSLFGDNNQDWDNSDAENPEDRKALWVKAGTLILEGYVYIPTLTEGTRDFTIGANAALVLNGDNVFLSFTTISSDRAPFPKIDYTGLSYSTSIGINDGNEVQGVYINGTLKVNAGILETNYSHGLVYRAESTANKLEINGGTITASQFRISGAASASTAKMSYIQTGGNFYLVQNMTNSAIFDLSAGLGTFNMSGGNIYINDISGGSTNAIYIGCTDNNINVSGGVVIIDNTSGTSATATINTTAPFHNFILKNNRNNDVQLQSSLIINNDFKLEAENFDAAGYNLSVASDFIINSGATYTTGANTTTFNGDKQTLIYLSALQTFNNLTISKEIDDKNFIIASAPVKAFQVNGDFRLENGILDYDNHTITLSGNVYLSDTIGTSTSTGGIYLNGSTTQTITSDNGCIQNIDIDNSNGITLSGNISINGILTLSNGIFDINTYKLTMLGDNAGFAGTFSSSNMIQTAGNASDGGIQMYIDANETITYPIGTNANSSVRYTPVTAAFSDYSDDGYVQIRISDNVLQTTNNAGSDVLSYYWRVSADSFTVNPTVQYIFTYDNSDLDGSTNANLFVPGKVLDTDPFTRSYENDMTKVDETAIPPTIIFNNSGSGFTLEEANYTAGQLDRFTGSIRIFYTRKESNAANTNWTDNNLWTFAPNDIDGNGTVDSYELHDSRQPSVGSGVYPVAGDIVFVGWVPYGDTGGGTEGYPHGVEVDRAVSFAELHFTKMLDANDGNPTERKYAYNFQFRPTVCVNPGGSLNGSIIAGEGMFWCRSASGTHVDPDFSSIDMGDFISEDSAYMVYESTNNSYVYNNIPSTVPNLLISGDGWGTNDRDFNISTDIHIMQDFELLGDVNLVLSSGATGDIIVENDLRMFRSTANGNDSGGGAEIAYPNNTSRTITVNGDLKLINAQSKINVRSPNTTVNIGYLNIAGDIYQDNTSGGGLQLYSASNEDYIKLTLQGDGNNNYTVKTGNITNLYSLTVNKGSNQSSSFSFNSDFDLNGPTNGTTKAIDLQNGLLILNDPGITVNLTTGGNDFNIPSTAGLVITQGIAYVNGVSTGIMLDGTLKINGGTLNMTSTPSENNYIQYGASGNATINISSGTLIVGTQIRRLTTSEAGILNYTQTGGDVTIGVNTDDVDYEETRGMLEVVNSESNFIFTGGTLTIVRQNGTSPSIAALYLNPETYNISNSTLQFCNSLTPTGQNNLDIYSNIPLYNVTINSTGSLADYPNINLNTLPLDIQGSLTINTNNTLDAKGLDLSITGNFVNNGIYTAHDNTITFNSTSSQSISGAGTEDIYNLAKINSGTLTLSKNITVNNILDIDNGTVATETNSLNVKGNTIIDGTVTSSSGSGLVFSGTSEQSLSRSSVGTSTLGIVTINNSNGVKISNTTHWFAISNKLRLQKGVFNIGGSLLELEENATIEAVSLFSVTNMIQTNSSFQDNGVKKNFSAGYTTDFIFPVGQLKYTPVTFDFSSASNTTGTTAGSITVRPADEYHPTINDGNDYFVSGDINNVLQYYWILRADNLTGFTSDVTFKYEVSDVKTDEAGKTEADYIAARIRANNNVDGDIDKFTTSEVDETTHEVIFRFSSNDENMIAGDYFAGIDEAIPDKVATYTSINGGGNITEDATFVETLLNSGQAPTGAILVVSSGDEVTLNVDDVYLYKTVIKSNGTLIVDETQRHRLGTVTGSGTIKIVSSISSIAFPAGDYIDYFTCSGGGIDYAGTGSYNVMSGISSIRNLIISGSGTKKLANNNIEICEDFTLSGSTFDNSVNKNITVNGNLIISSGTFNSGTSNSITVAGTATISGGTYDGQTGGNDVFNNLTINSGAFNVGSGGSIAISGNITFMEGTFNGGSGTANIILNGSSTQTITGNFTGVSQFYNIEVDNSNGLTLSGDVTIENILTLTNGIITPGANKLLINSAATISPEKGTSTSFINGKLYKTIGSSGGSFIFPVGKGTILGYAGINDVNTGGVTWDVEYFNSSAINETTVTNLTPTDAATIKDISNIEYWKISDGSTAHTGNTAKIGLSWNSNSEVSALQSEREKLTIVVWDEGNSSWDNFNGSDFSSGHTQDGGYFISTSSVAFSSNIVTLGTGDPNNTLPVELLYFTGKANVDNIELNWATETETNNDYFEIQRSIDAVNYTTIGKIYGAGNSMSKIKYLFTDKSPNFGINYYRLKQVDYNGDYEIFNSISINWDGTKPLNDDFDIMVYPNPYKSGDLNIELKQIEPNTNIRILLTDVSGNIIFNAPALVPVNSEINLIPKAVSHLSQGIYILRISTDNNVVTKRIIVN
jgi:hypothetical protein